MPDLEAEGIPPMDEPPPGLEDDNQVEGLVPPGDEPVGVDELGITPEEERMQEPIAERVEREEPDVFRSRPGDELHARLIEPDQGVVGLDDERDPVAGTTEDDDGLSAEEAAMHITDTP